MFRRLRGYLLVSSIPLIVLLGDYLPSPLQTYDSQRVFLIILLCLAVMGSILGFGFGGAKALISHALPTFLLPCLFLLLALPHLNRDFVWVDPIMYAFFFLGTVLVGRLLSERGTAQYWTVIALEVVTVFVCLYSALTLIVYIAMIIDEVENFTAFLPLGFLNIRYWSHVATWLLPLLPLAVLMCPLREKVMWRVAAAFGAAVWWWLVFMSTARGTMLGVLLGSLVVLATFRKSAVPWLLVSVRYVLYGLVVWVLLSVVVPQMLLQESDVRSISTQGSGRAVLFVEAWEMSVISFPLGLGPLSWLTHSPITDAYQRFYKFGHPHNMYLMWAAEYGWLLLIGGLAWAGRGIRNVQLKLGERRLSGDGGIVLLSGVVASVIAAFVHSVVSAVFIAPGSMLVGFAVLILFWALSFPESFRNGVTNRQLGRQVGYAGTALAMLAALSLSALLLYQMHGYYRAMYEDRQYNYQSVGAGLKPRFWAHGYFPRPSKEVP